jgi:hypothetical protein
MNWIIKLNLLAKDCIHISRFWFGIKMMFSSKTEIIGRGEEVN